jgi:RNA polymerase sigma-70 factor (ECF subfamily)
MDNEPDDIELVTRAQQGDRDAFTRLVERYYSDVVAAAYTILSNAETAKECAQESFLEAARTLDKLREKNKFRQWIYGISRNKAIYLLHRQKLHNEAMKVKTDESRRMKPVFGPSEQMGKIERVEGIRKALGQIPEIYREVLVLKYIDGRSHADIGKLLDISMAAVDKRLMRAKDMLRESLQKWKTED